MAKLGNMRKCWIYSANTKIERCDMRARLVLGLIIGSH